MISSRRSAGKVGGLGDFSFKLTSFQVKVNYDINIGVPSISKKKLTGKPLKPLKELLHRSLHAVEDGSFLPRFV